MKKALKRFFGNRVAAESGPERFLRALYRRLKRAGAQIRVFCALRRVVLDSLYMGGFNSETNAQFCRRCGTTTYKDVPLRESPYVALFKDFGTEGRPLEMSAFERHPYCRMALACIETYGHFFSAHDSRGIMQEARRFLDMFHARRAENAAKRRHRDVRPGRGHSGRNFPVVFKRAHGSGFEIADGHHRLAMMFVLGKKRCFVQRKSGAQM